MADNIWDSKGCNPSWRVVHVLGSNHQVLMHPDYVDYCTLYGGGVYSTVPTLSFAVATHLQRML
jgi:hypothetical protein